MEERNSTEQGEKSVLLLDVRESGEERSSTDADESFSLWGDEGVVTVGVIMRPYVEGRRMVECDRGREVPSKRNLQINMCIPVEFRMTVFFLHVVK